MHCGATPLQGVKRKANIEERADEVRDRVIYFVIDIGWYGDNSMEATHNLCKFCLLSPLKHPHPATCFNKIKHLHLLYLLRSLSCAPPNP